MARRTLAAALLVIAVLAVSQPSSAAQASTTKLTERVFGYLQGYPGDCPPADSPQEPVVCHEVVLSAWRIGFIDAPGPISARDTTWVLSVVRHTLTFPGGGADPTESDVVEGFAASPVVTFDQQHLGSAQVLAHVPMSDGSTLDVDATWTATSDRLLFGNDGPALAEAGRLHHQRTPCLNEVHQAHQKYRLAHVHAVLNGVPSEDLSIFAFLAHNQFTSVEVVPASCR